MIDLKKETYGKAAKVAPNFWIIATHHRPGLSKHMFEINNRCLVFKLRDKKENEDVLLASNATDESAIPEIRKIEKETGLKLKYIVAPGGGHHMHIPKWYEEFKTATVMFPPTRLPRTRTGKKLMGKPRVQVLNLQDPLSQFKGQLEAVVFNGIFGASDLQAPGEGGKDTKFNLMKAMLHVMTQVKDPTDELWIYHVPTKTVIGGENLSWFYTKEELSKQPFMLKGMIKPDKLSIMSMGRKVQDKNIVKANWKRILNWPIETVMTYHELPGYAYHGDGNKALKDAAAAAKQI